VGLSRVLPASTADSGRYLKGVTLIAAALLWLSMLVLPTAYEPAKGFLLAMVMSALLLRAGMERRLRVNRRILLLSLAYAGAGLFWVGVGVVQHAPGALRMSPVFVLWPLVYTLLISGADDDTLAKSGRVLLGAALIICAYSLLFVLTGIHLLPSSWFVDLNQDARIGIYPGFMQFNLSSLTTLLFLVPYLVAVQATKPRLGIGTWRDGLVWSALAASALVAAFSLRRSLIVLVVLSPVIALILLVAVSDARINFRLRRVVVIAAVMAALMGLGVSAVALVTTGKPTDNKTFVANAASGFDLAGGSQVGATERRDQFWALIDGWRQHPILGAGLGATVSLRRSVDQPWAYELVYVDLLFQTGVVGFLVYTAGIGWIYWQCVKATRRTPDLIPRLLPVLAGTTGFLIANATDPYLAKFDYLWVLFLPIAYLNYSFNRRIPTAPDVLPTEREFAARA
jgi:O-antigen ligase